MTVRKSMAKAIGVAVACILCGCVHRSAAPGVAPAHEADPGQQVALLHTEFVVSSCPDAKKMDSRAANAAMRKLVEPCAKVPGKAVRFQATLVPGGQIELASPTGERAEGIVPLCAVKNKLTHSLVLKERCTFDVLLEERTISAEQGSKDKP
jgi:hypothetical protein